MGKINQVFTQFLLKSSWKSLFLGLVLVGAIGYGVTQLTANFSYRIWFNEDNPKLQEFDAFERRFGSDEVAVVVVHSPSGVFDLESSKLLIDITNELWQVPEVIRVDSLANFNWVHAEEDDIIVEPLIPDDIPLTPALLEERKNIAINHNTISGYLVDKSATTALVFAVLKPALNSSPDYEKVVNGVYDIVNSYKGQGDHIFHVTGGPAVSYAFQDSTQQDMQKIIPVVLLITVLFLAFTFRRFSGVALCFVIIIFTILSTLGFAGWAGLEINNLTSVVPQFMIAVSIAVAVHILVTYYQFLRKGIEKNEAIRLTLDKNVRPTLLTSISTAIGFFSFMTAIIPPIAQMGLMAGFGTLVSWLISYLIMVPLLVKLPAKVKVVPQENEEDLAASPRSTWFTEQLYKHRVIIMAFSLVLMGLSIYAISKVQVNSDPFNYFSKKYPLRIANEFVEKQVGGALGADIVIDSGSIEGIKDPEFLQKVEDFQLWLDEFPFVTKTVSIVNILKEMNKSFNGDNPDYFKLPETRDTIAQLLFLYTMNLPVGMDINDRVAIENDAIRLTAQWTLHDSKRILEQIDNFESKAKELGLDVYVTGKMPLYQYNNPIVVSSFIKSITMAIVLVSILLIIGLRSVKLGLLSIIPNGIPLLAGAPLLWMFDQPLDIGTVIVGSVCLGIAVDDTIHFLSNFQKYLSWGDTPKQAVSRVLTYTAPALLTTTTVLVFAFASFMLGTFVPNQNFGRFVALILSIALIFDLTLLPTIVMSMKWDKERS